MKRGGPLQRKSPMKRGAGPVRRNQKKPEPRTRYEMVRKAVRDDAHSMSWADVRRIIWVRCGGACEACGRRLTFSSMEGHHRRTRSIGPDCPCNALALCYHCHHVRVHGQPEKARELGRIISRHDRNAPAAQPVRLRWGVVYLACDGTLTKDG